MKNCNYGDFVPMARDKELIMVSTILKVIVATILASIIFLWLNKIIGYERSELLAFSLLIGISCASMKSH